MNNRVYWFRRTLEDVPASNLWLSAAEEQRLEALRIPKRRADWRLGRWTAKQAVSLCLNLPSDEYGALARLEIRASECGAPEAYLADERVDISLSLSHRDGVGICAIAPVGVELGCDVETIEPHSAEFIMDYFDIHELETVADAPGEDRILLVSLMWSAKESALKALKEGLRADARSVHIRLMDWDLQCREWNAFQAAVNDRVYRGWWRSNGCSLYTFTADSPIAPPTLLVAPEERSSRAANSH
ncbi:MAG TPA: 4'-phosphopantetheinyl transferase superfamily protein [Terriglobales bacterium]